MKVGKNIEKVLLDVFELDIEDQLALRNDKITLLERSKIGLQSEITLLGNRSLELATDNDYLTQKVELMQSQGLPEIFPEEDYWNNKHPKANIKYVARKHPATGEPMGIDIKLVVTPSDFEIHTWLKKRDLYVQNPTQLNQIVTKIYFKHQKYWFLYGSDIKNFGQSEFWAFPWELRAMRKAKKALDCDDWSNSIVSHLRAAGVPAWRVRIVCGPINDKQRYGHSTVYVLDDSLQTWRHLNSTSINAFNDLTEAPTSQDRNDKMGIRPDEIWMSFNDQYAWHTFDTRASSNSFKDNGWRDRFKITPILG